MPEQEQEQEQPARRTRKKPPGATSAAKTPASPPRGRRKFSTASGTAPTADETLTEPASTPTPRRPAVQTPERPDAKNKKSTKEDDRVAFTWRLDPPKVMQHDQLMFRIRRELQQPRIDKATVMDTLVSLVDENQSVYGALIARLRGAR